MNALFPSDPKVRTEIEQIVGKLRQAFDLSYENGGLCFFQLANVVARYKDKTNREYYVTMRRIVPDSIQDKLLGLVDYNKRHISINCSVRSVKIPFVLAHELAHVALSHVSPGIELPEVDRVTLLNTQEVEADYFAYCLLMPEDIFRASAIVCKNRLRLMAPMLNVPREFLMRRYVMLKEGSLHFEIRDSQFFRMHSNPPGIKGRYTQGVSAKGFISQHNFDSSSKSYLRKTMVFDSNKYDCKIFNTTTEFDDWAIHCLAVREETGWGLA